MHGIDEGQLLRILLQASTDLNLPALSRALKEDLHTRHGTEGGTGGGGEVESEEVGRFRADILAGRWTDTLSPPSFHALFPSSPSDHSPSNPSTSTSIDMADGGHEKGERGGRERGEAWAKIRWAIHRTAYLEALALGKAKHALSALRATRRLLSSEGHEGHGGHEGGLGERQRVQRMKEVKRLAAGLRLLGRPRAIKDALAWPGFEAGRRLLLAQVQRQSFLLSFFLHTLQMGLDLRESRAGAGQGDAPPELPQCPARARCRVLSHAHGRRLVRSAADQSPLSLRQLLLSRSLSFGSLSGSSSR